LLNNHIILNAHFVLIWFSDGNYSTCLLSKLQKQYLNSQFLMAYIMIHAPCVFFYFLIVMLPESNIGHRNIINFFNIIIQNGHHFSTWNRFTKLQSNNIPTFIGPTNFPTIRIPGFFPDTHIKIESRNRMWSFWCDCLEKYRG